MSNQEKPRIVPDAESCAECPAVKRGTEGDPGKRGVRHCELFGVEWWNCAPESWERACEREGWLE